MAENPAYLDGLLKDLEDHPLDTTLRRMIADHWEEEGDHFTADLWRFHAAVLEGGPEPYVLKPELTQRIRDMVRGTVPGRDTHSYVRVMRSAPREYQIKAPEKTNSGIIVGILWLIENGFVTP